MNRFLTICCSLALAGPTSTALCATPSTTSNQAMLAKRGLSEFDLDGNGTLDANERAAAVAARNAARHQTSLSTTGATGSRNSLSASSSTTRYADSAGAGGSYLVINPPPSQCPIQNAERAYFAGPHPISGGSVVTPANIVFANNASTGGNGSVVFDAGSDLRIVTPSNLPRPAVITGPQLPNSSSGASVYWVPNSNVGQQPMAMGSGMVHGMRRGR